MKNITFIYAPFCTPASPPYSLTYLAGFLKQNAPEISYTILDLNIAFHARRYPQAQKYFKTLREHYTKEDYEAFTKTFFEDTKETYARNNKAILQGESPEEFQAMLTQILATSPEVVGFSIIYSSQAFYVSALIDALKSKGIKVVIGGPAVNHNLRSKADAVLANEVEFLQYLTEKEMDHQKLDTSRVLDFSSLPLEEYFVPEVVLPLRSTNTCYYQQCAFCTHHGNLPYMEYALEDILSTIETSGCKYIFFTDDMIHKKRLLQIAELLKPLDVRWMCQLRPTKELDKETLLILYNSGLRHVIWGVESGCDRVLDAMQKGTNTTDAQKVLLDAHEVGIKNGVYIMFGFPTETKEEFLQTIAFLKKNSEIIDIVSTAVFGLQQGARAFDEPLQYGIMRVQLEERSLLDAKVHYEVESGLTNEQVKLLRKKHKGTLEAMDKYPKQMNFFREHLFCLCP